MSAPGEPITPADPAWPRHCSELTGHLKRAVAAHDGASTSPQLTAYVLISAAYAIARAPTASRSDRQRIMRWCGEACMNLAALERGADPQATPG